MAACVAEAGEVVLQDESGDQAGQAVQAGAVDVVDVDEVSAAAWRGKEVVTPARGRPTVVRQYVDGLSTLTLTLTQEQGLDAADGDHNSGSRRDENQSRGRRTTCRSGFHSPPQKPLRKLDRHVSMVEWLGRGWAQGRRFYFAQPSRLADGQKCRARMRHRNSEA